MPAPTIAVVIPVFNRESLIGDALRCVSRQTLVPASLVVIDDGSTDGSAEVVERFFRDGSPPFRTALIRQANAGVGAARRRAVDESPRCELLAMLDSDDMWPDDYLQRMAGVLGENPRAVGASCDRVLQDVVSGERTPRSSKHLIGRATSGIFLEGTSPSSATVIRWDAYERAGGYDPAMKFKDDVDLYLRVSLRGDWLYVPGLAVTLRRNTASSHGAEHLTRKSIPNRREMVELLERFAARHASEGGIPERAWKRHLARLWFRLGRDYSASGDRIEGQESFARSTRLNPWQVRAWWRRVLSALTG